MCKRLKQLLNLYWPVVQSNQRLLLEFFCKDIALRDQTRGQRPVSIALGQAGNLAAAEQRIGLAGVGLILRIHGRGGRDSNARDGQVRFRSGVGRKQSRGTTGLERIGQLANHRSGDLRCTGWLEHRNRGRCRRSKDAQVRSDDQVLLFIALQDDRFGDEFRFASR